ncbi:cell wall-active antibiotics response protein LiaF [Alkalihalobacillus trypoxylicola]|uniref:Uncharacterized protein n=1 Tax=Alkalihalobacillus trypoxylicola TaxID=519424 RepID=A0A161QNB2_9BACI|nr:cell wall-active antibiotics response protein LiaF [Alkalihalobacillus trypoxylicola]KYG31843.1 hypothetical protein AZF04_03430 [Alkalihalobacillus trypoxylicola]GAF65705.1 hypothetical protein BTS2_2604 [Bacillus sp. TS-2]
MNKKTLFGLFILIIGINIFFGAFHITTGSLFAPLLFIIIGYYFSKKGRNVLSKIFYLLSAIIFLDQFLGLNFFALFFAGLFLFYGIKFIKEPSKKRDRRRTDKEERKKRYEEKESDTRKVEEDLIDSPYHQSTFMDDNDFNYSEKYLEKESLNDTHYSSTYQNQHSHEHYTPIVRRNILGDIHYNQEQFELQDMTIWNVIGDVKIDLSRAIIPEGEHVIIVQAFIGQIDIYVPEDIAVTVQTSSLVGEVTLFHEKYSGFNHQVQKAPKYYKQSPRRIKLILSTLVGEVRVREL